MVQIVKVFGSAGCGKTTYLISKIKEYLKKGYELEDIGFFSFSKAAIMEARKRLRIHPDRELYFSTLHSLAYKAMRYNFKTIYCFEKIKQSESYDPCDDIFRNELEKLNAYIKSSKCNYTEAQKYLRTSISETHLNYFMERRKREFKQNQVMDFSDLIASYIKSNVFPKFKILIIDEAQDLTPLLWELVTKLIEKTSDYVLLAGDDDQAIYGFGGAKAKYFISFKEDKRFFLKTNYRNPSNHYKLANKKISILKNRVDKNITTFKSEGSLKKHPSFDSVLFPRQDDNFTTAILFRTRMDALLFQEYFISIGRNFVMLNGKISKNKYRNIISEPANTVISTIHKVKGKEFDRVVYFHKELMDFDKELGIDFLEDEIRLLFVALTRSKEALDIVDEDNIFTM